MSDNLSLFELNNEKIENTRILELRKKIIEADTAYYVDAQPLMTDREYDLLMQELRWLRQQAPDAGPAPVRNLRDDLPPHY